MKRYTLNRPLLLRNTSAERAGYGNRGMLFNPTVELPGKEANPMLDSGDLLTIEENKGLPKALDLEVREYQSVIFLPDDLAKRPLAKGSLTLLEEEKSKKQPAKKAPAKVKEEAK